MIKIACISDIHLEGRAYNYALPDCDVLCLAGDIDSNKQRLDSFLEKAKAQIKTVVYTRGNHEGYNRAGIAWGDNYNSVTEVEDVVFIATPLWTGMNLGTTPDKCVNQWLYGMNDARYMRIDYKQFIKQHEICLNFLTENIDRYHNKKKIVVVTHYLPSIECVPWEYKGSTLNPFFVAKIKESLINKVDTWFFGHTHSCIDFKLGNCRMVCNALGYQGENTGFNPEKVVEL